MKKQHLFPRSTQLMFLLIVLAVVLHSGVSFGEEKETQVKPGTIRLQQIYDYPHLAHITMNDAEEIAITHTKGDIIKIGFEEENGFLVYEVQIATPQRTLTEVTIDAGNGKILSIEENEQDDDEESNCR
jgi:hypothetical protein